MRKFVAQVIVCLPVVGTATNPTHYGDPAGGCEPDEQAVQVQGLPGRFCSPPCSGGNCPSDVPAGDTATPQCALSTTTGDKYCALICTPSLFAPNGASGECGTGTCQAIQGVGLCTYSSSELNAHTISTSYQPAALTVNPTHYGNPAGGCESDEKAVQVQGLPGNFCSAQCYAGGSCPPDIPSGDTAVPSCVLQTPSGDKYCALVCTPSQFSSNGAVGECGTGTCQAIAGRGLCTYSNSLSLTSAFVASLNPFSFIANPTHYGSPAGGCESDEQAVQVQGIPGAFCSPPCSASGSCPADVPSGDTARPTCALQTPTGSKFCALICTPSAVSSNGANGECGTGTCQAIQGLGLCTYSKGRSAEGTAAAVVQPQLLLANPTHYGSPAGGCESDEQAVQVQGVPGAFCSPPCSASGSCPADVPSGDTARPTCALQTPTGGKFCALICTPSAITSNGANGECGTGTCQAIQGLGLCTYSNSRSSVAIVAAVFQAWSPLANPTHYGSPAGGCESDEQAVQVQGVPGAFCSPPCSASGSCPTDVPSGDTARPTCALQTPTGGKFCALICTPSAITSNGANGECGTGTCQAIQGLGLCTYSNSRSSVATVAAVFQARSPLANPTHYGSPAGGCESDEQAVQVQGVPGAFCSPPCSASGSCPTDVPSGDTARPTCALQTPTGSKFCALICTPSTISLNGANGECGTGSCQSIQGVGLCTYSNSQSSDESAAVVFQAQSLLANPTHYGSPAGGCESDEQAVRVQGVPGGFCSPPCSASGSCPTDVPSGDTARPTCALQTPPGGKFCALICTPSTISLNGANGECGTGTCQAIQGVGLCTYSDKSSAWGGELAVAFPSDELLANPTHYGSPATGCESDEQAVQVQGVPGAFCSPPCSAAGSCPADIPSGDTARPMCALQTPTGSKFCALICTPSALVTNGADGECGEGTCQSIQGVGICTYAGSNSAVASVALSVSYVPLAANPTHYGDPKTGCESDEKAVQVQGVPGAFCSPPCNSGDKCPADVPSGDTARPMCALQSPTGDKYCALICTPSTLVYNGANGECGAGHCQSVQGVGLCTYSGSKAITEVAALIKPLVFAAMANPTHYGDPAQGCESDEQAVQVQGVPGAFCSPPCSAGGSCPIDVPRGDTARPQCALQTPTGGKFCALLCTPSVLATSGANGECGTGTCQPIQGIGLCTYPSTKLDVVATALKPTLADKLVIV